MNTIETLRPGRGDINAAAELPPPGHAAEYGLDRACALLGIPAVAPDVPRDAAVTAVIFQDTDEYLREIFGERAARAGAKIVQPHPIVHLDVAPQTTPPRAA